MIKQAGSIYLLVAVLVIISPHQTRATKYTVCDTNKSYSQVKDVKISDCESSTEACPFLRGFNKSIELDFIPNQKVEQVKIKVAGKLKTLPVPFHVSPDNACGNYGFDCPLEAGKTYKFKMTLPILRSYPKINVDVFLRLIDEKGEVIGCVEMPAHIQEPEKPGDRR